MPAPFKAKTSDHAGNAILARGTPIGFRQASRLIMWMPGGVHDITASQGGKPRRVRVQVDQDTAAVAQAALEAHQAHGPQRPFFDFDHDNRAASAWPIKFGWQDGPKPGVYAEVEWTDPGSSAVQGKSYRSFSPTFFVDDDSPARVIGAPLNMGGLVNNPAFQQMNPLWAKAQSEPTMNKHAQLLAILAAIATLQTDRAALAAKSPTDNAAAIAEKDAAINAKLAEAELIRAGMEEHEAGEVAAKDEELKALRVENERFKVEARATRKRDAEAAVTAAINRGALPPKATELHAKWVAQIEADPKAADLLNALQTAPAVQAGRIVQPGDSERGRVVVTRIDCNDAFNGYVEAKDHKAKGEVYVRDIHPRLEAGERLPFERFPAGRDPVQAANTLGTLVGNIISQRTLSLIFSRRPMLRGATLDLSDEQVKLNQQVSVRTIGLPTVQNFGSAATDTADTDYSVTLNAHKQVLFSYTATEYNATGRDLVAEHSQALSAALGNSICDALAALITAAFTSNTVGVASTKDYSSVANATKVLNSAGVPDMRRFGWVNADVAEALRNDELVMANFDRQTTAAYAHWRNMMGFDDIWEFPALPGNSINLIGFLGMSDALLLASRVILNPEAIVGASYPGKLQTITDPVSGLSVVSNQWIGASDLAINDRLIVAYGVARGNLTCGHRWVSA